ncbi:hypothetical protein BCR36DRAFT_584716 [Piromyces finnis]|uniref:Uncharacterized protein n=1 Tax=Piromyces finnis TaxID=1754191 RepID=A0A1Y1V598_9FUNG|nr:hypothetical protein BCR36DRAFT_584716 [Piromyces finnis]|eukprot:ORX47613.1 hypothetical protein BCR36DRAFT_584716 [Piromyces finnis]
MVRSNLLALIFAIAFAVYSSAYPQILNEEEELPINTLDKHIDDDVAMPPKSIPTELPTESLLDETKPSKTISSKTLPTNKPGNIPDFGKNGGMKGLPEFNSTSGPGMKGLPNHEGMKGGFPKFNNTMFGGMKGGFPKFNNTMFGGMKGGFPKFNNTMFGGMKGGFPKFNNTMFGGMKGGFPKFNNTMFNGHLPEINGSKKIPAPPKDLSNGNHPSKPESAQAPPKDLSDVDLPSTSKTIPTPISVNEDESLPTTKSVPTKSVPSAKTIPTEDESLPTTKSIPSTKALPVSTEEELITKDVEEIN